MKTVMFPGQGAQYTGMGAALFPRFPHHTRRASEIVGYDLAELCVHDPQHRLTATEYTQPAVYVVNALAYFAQQDAATTPDFLLGHSLGEYNALLAAGAFDFETGLRLVFKRGELMAAASDGGMLAVLNLTAREIEDILQAYQITGIDIANYNTDSQIVVSGSAAAIEQAKTAFAERAVSINPLKVSAPFHSRHMQPARDEFAAFLKGFSFAPIAIPVIANSSARPYRSADIAGMLSEQITSPVCWYESIRYLLDQDANMTFSEIESSILTKMVARIRAVQDAPAATL